MPVPDEQPTLATSVRAAAGRADVLDSVAGVYADVQREVDARKPRCDASGRCCHFDEYGHRLYVTTMELAAFVTSLRAATVSPVPASTLRFALPLFDESEPGCRFQRDGLCSVHAIRPFGCRIYFCDPTAQTWQQDLYEVFHERLKREHDRLGVPYFYVEWRAALREVLLDAIPRTPNNAGG